jgi:lysophospholipase L1-like esterase
LGLIWSKPIRNRVPASARLAIWLTVACARFAAAVTGPELTLDAAASARPDAVTPAVAQLTKGGPTPYPKDQKDWPGVGAISVLDFMMHHRQNLWSQRAVNQGAVVFVGDSNIEAWTSLKDDFAPMHVANAGLGGDVSRGLLFRLKEDVIDLNPSAVVILIGSIDVAAREGPALLISNLTSVLQELRAYNHSLPIVLCKLPPRGQDSSPLYNQYVQQVNSRFDNLVKSDPKLALLDLYQLLSLPDGSLDPHNFNSDAIHISPTGYRKFHDALVLIFRSIQVE